MSDYDFPILGEPFPIELANTHYRSLSESIDFLGDRTAIQPWFTTAAAAPLPCPSRPSNAWHRQFLALRDATRASLDALASGTPPTPTDLEVLTATAASATRRRALDWEDGARITVCYEGPAGSRELAAMADAVIDFLASDQAALVRLCAAEDCSMLFVRHHHRRRWCHDGCSHRVRQARYYRRRIAGNDE